MVCLGDQVSHFLPLWSLPCAVLITLSTVASCVDLGAASGLLDDDDEITQETGVSPDSTFVQSITEAAADLRSQVGRTPVYCTLFLQSGLVNL